MLHIHAIKQQFLPFFFFMLLLIAFFAWFPIPKVKAATVDINRTINTLSYDGDIETQNSTYSTCRTDVDGIIDDSGTTIWIGQRYVAMYFIYRGYLFFNTSLIPDSATITEAVLSIYVLTDVSSSDFNVTIQNGQPNYPHAPLETTDLDQSKYSGNGGNRSTSEISGAGYWNITLNSDGLSWINKTSLTKLCLRSSEDIGASAPSGLEYIIIRQLEAGQAYIPKLYVTYETEGYYYTLHGAYYENGAVYNGIVNVTFSKPSEPDTHIILNGTDGVADIINATSEQQGISLTWNISSTEQNKTRTYSLTDAESEQIYIYIPDSDDPAYIYTFTVTDFYGVTNGFIETIIDVEGYQRIVERQSLEVINMLPFWMSWAHSYVIRLICDEGVYEYGSFIALNEGSQNLVITSGMFDYTYQGINATVSSLRMNETWIQTNYTDNDSLTSWVNVSIREKSGYNWIESYSTNNTGQTQTVNWYSADSETNYRVIVTALRNSEIETWSFSCPAPINETSVWGTVFDLLGTFPFESKYLLGLFIVLSVFAVFSYAYMPLGCILGVLTAGLMVYVQFLNISWGLIGLAFAIAIIAAIRLRKREEGVTT